VEFAEGDLAKLDKLYGMQGIVNRCVALTAEFKMAYGEHYDSMAMLPDFYMNISQAPNFITEFPHNIHKCVEEYYKAHSECLVEIAKMDKFPVEFRQRVKALLTKQ
jgi:hypothetical protein